MKTLWTTNDAAAQQMDRVNSPESEAEEATARAYEEADLEECI